MVNLKFAAGQQNRAGYTGSVNCVPIIGGGERVTQRARSAVISICDYDDVSRERVALLVNSFCALAR